MKQGGPDTRHDITEKGTYWLSALRAAEDTRSEDISGPSICCNKTSQMMYME